MEHRPSMTVIRKVRLSDSKVEAALGSFIDREFLKDDLSTARVPEDVIHKLEQIREALKATGGRNDTTKRSRSDACTDK